ncbi:MAG: hypothetical protein QF596_06105, partial [Acidimicrobiales bacterium]|nr:hypothetical protein [Acidimicrobiales bacterium]
MKKNIDTSTKSRTAQIMVLALLIPAIFLGSLALGTSKEASAAEHNSEPTINCDNGGRVDEDDVAELMEPWGQDWHIPAWLQSHADNGCFDERITVTVEEVQLTFEECVAEGLVEGDSRVVLDVTFEWDPDVAASIADDSLEIKIDEANNQDNHFFSGFFTFQEGISPGVTSRFVLDVEPDDLRHLYVYIAEDASFSGWRANRGAFLYKSNRSTEGDPDNLVRTVCSNDADGDDDGIPDGSDLEPTVTAPELVLSFPDDGPENGIIFPTEMGTPHTFEIEVIGDGGSAICDVEEEAFGSISSAFGEYADSEVPGFPDYFFIEASASVDEGTNSFSFEIMRVGEHMTEYPSPAKLTLTVDNLFPHCDIRNYGGLVSEVFGVGVETDEVALRDFVIQIPVYFDSDGDGLLSDEDPDDTDDDVDGDGVLDGAEEEGCVENADCDGDGLEDGEDSQPLDNDHDDDGLVDNEDPDSTNPDVDDDGVLDGAEEEGCVENADCDGDGLEDGDPRELNPLEPYEEAKVTIQAWGSSTMTGIITEEGDCNSFEVGILDGYVLEGETITVTWEFVPGTDEAVFTDPEGSVTLSVDDRATKNVEVCPEDDRLVDGTQSSTVVFTIETNLENSLVKDLESGSTTRSRTVKTKDNDVDADGDGLLADVDPDDNNDDVDDDGLLDGVDEFPEDNDHDDDGLVDNEDPDRTNPDVDGDGVLDGAEEEGCVENAD